MLAPVDPFKTHSSESLEQDLTVGFHEANYGVSIDVEELFYSVLHGELFLAVHDATESCSVVPFQNTSLINMDNFLELLKCYLCSTIVSFDKIYVQKKEHMYWLLCCAYALRDFLAKLDRQLAPEIEKKGISFKSVRHCFFFLCTE